jgi:NAD+ synthetase
MSSLRVAVAQIRPAKGDYAGNLRRVGEVLAQVSEWDRPPQLVVFPETVLSGYFVEDGVRDVAVSAGTLFRDLALQHSLAGAPPLDVALGFYELHASRLYNSALYAALGGAAPGIRHVHRKVFLPTYGMFDEERFVDRGHEVRAFDTTWGRAALLICEDGWHAVVPSLAALDGAQVIILPSAAPARGAGGAGGPPGPGGGGAGSRIGEGSLGTRPESVERWERLVCGIAQEHGVFVVLAQLVGFEAGKGFPGASVVVGPDGEVLARAPLFEEALLSVEVDLGELARARAEQPLLADLETELPHLWRWFEIRERRPLAFDPEDPAFAPALSRPSAARLPVVPPLFPRDPLAVDPELVERWLIAFLQDEVVRQRGFTKALVGLSGGVDSSLVAILAAKALGPDQVIGVRLPYKTSSPESLAHAELVAAQAGIRLETIDLTAAVDGYVRASAAATDPLRLGNLVARARMMALFDLSARYGALPLGTGNKTERLMGYFTWHGDDAPPVNPLGDLFKTQVLAVARYAGVPDVILEKPATADLVPGQTDEGDLGISYARLDRILYHLLRGTPRPHIEAQGVSAEEIELVRRRLEATHFKRHLPAVAVLSHRAIGESYLRPLDYGQAGGAPARDAR